MRGKECNHIAQRTQACRSLKPGYFMNSRHGVTATTDIVALPGVLGCRPLRRTGQVRLGTNPAGRLPGTRRKRPRCAWHAHLRGLATAIHEISGLKLKTHFTADGLLPCIEQHEIITEIPRVARRALVSFLQKLKKNGKERECHSLLF